jgi:serine protease AprX
LASASALVVAGALALSPGAQARQHDASVVVLEQRGAGMAPESAVRALGGTVERQLPIVGGFAARVPAGSLAELRRSKGVRSVARDRRLSVRNTEAPAPDASTPLAAARAAIGADRIAGDGRGVGVALVDTGVARVPALAGKVVDGPDFSADGGDPARRSIDAFGHGTHLAGIIAGSDAASGLTGIAPGARIVNVRVADHDGATSLVRLLAGIDWVVRNARRGDLDIRVLSLAVGGSPEGGYRQDPLALAVERAWQHGLAVVVSAGNGGNATTTLDSPAYDPFVIAVGAEDTADTPEITDDHVAAFSSRGSAQRSPDVVAPGVGIVSLRVPGSLLDQSFPGARIGEAFFRGSGTSQSAAVVSGAAALLIAQRPGLTPDAVKALLRASARVLPGFDAQLQGAGLPDLEVAAGAVPPVGAEQRWPSAAGGARWRIRGAAGVQLAAENAAAWQANRWRADAWQANRWRADTWQANRWRTSTWTASGWDAAPLP